MIALILSLKKEEPKNLELDSDAGKLTGENK